MRARDDLCLSGEDVPNDELVVLRALLGMGGLHRVSGHRGTPAGGLIL